MNGRTSGRLWRRGTRISDGHAASRATGHEYGEKSKNDPFQHSKGNRRRAAPRWSAPAELFLICASPSYLSVGPRRLEGIGVEKITKTAKKVHTCEAGVGFRSGTRATSTPFTVQYTLLNGVGHSADQGVDPPKRTTCRNGRGTTQKRCGKRSDDTHEAHPTCGHIWARSSLSSRGATQWERERHRGPTGTALTNSNMRRGAILQAGQNVHSRHIVSPEKRLFVLEALGQTRSSRPQPWNESY